MTCIAETGHPPALLEPCGERAAYLARDSADGDATTPLCTHHRHVASVPDQWVEEIDDAAQA